MLQVLSFNFNHVFNEIFGNSQDLPERQQCKIIDGGDGLDLSLVVPGDSVKSKILKSRSASTYLTGRTLLGEIPNSVSIFPT